MKRQAIFVTGGTGAVGRRLVSQLCQQGRSVKVAGRRAAAELPGEYVQCDVTDLDRLLREMAGCDTVVHLAAVARPGLSAPEDLFHTNACGTFCVYEAAARCGVRHIVTASSINALGYSFGPGRPPVQYFPVDEQHPTSTSDAYSFSKNVVESIGDYYYRREGITTLALRLPWVRRLSVGDRDSLSAEQQQVAALLDDLLATPNHPWMVNWRQMHARLHDLRVRETLAGDGWSRPELAPGQWETAPDALTWSCLFGRDNFWTAIDERDSARAIALAVDAEVQGSHALFVSDSRNWLGLESEKLLRAFFPEVTHRKRRLSGAESLVSIEKAQRLLGFAPQHHLNAMVEAPMLTGETDRRSVL